MAMPLSFVEMSHMTVAYAPGKAPNGTVIALLIRRDGRGTWCHALSGNVYNGGLYRTAGDAVAAGGGAHGVQGKGDNRPPPTAMPSGGIKRHG